MMYYVTFGTNGRSTSISVNETEGSLPLHDTVLITQGHPYLILETTENEDGEVSNVIRGPTAEELEQEKTKLELVKKESDIRIERNSKLAATDVFMLFDKYNSLTDVQQKAITKYRQDLRDITTQKTFPEKVTWPVYPL
jgi:hypothetical protein